MTTVGILDSLGDSGNSYSDGSSSVDFGGGDSGGGGFGGDFWLTIKNYHKGGEIWRKK